MVEKVPMEEPRYKLNAPIGVFDSGFGGLTVLKEIVRLLPQYDYLYLGDNARAPYGNRSFDTVHEYTLQCVELLFYRGCQLVILACNTASAKALRTIQQKDLPTIDSTKRVLGVIRPTTEMVGNYSKTKNIGVLGTMGTIASMSYPIEIEKFFPGAQVFQQACPMWVPLVENNEFDGDGADYFIKQDIDKLLSQNNTIDTIILACTHYPLLMNKIKKHLPAGIQIVSQGEIVAQSLVDYLNRHQDMESRFTKGKTVEFLTTDSTEFFDRYTQLFFGQEVKSQQVVI